MLPKILTAHITFDADGGDDDVDQRIRDIAEEEGLKFAAMLTDRLEDEGIDDIEVRVN